MLLSHEENINISQECGVLEMLLRAFFIFVLDLN